MWTYGLEMIRSDEGDGGWSLHDPANEDDEGMPKRILLSGPAAWRDELAYGCGDWDAPTQEHYDEAERLRLATAA